MAIDRGNWLYEQIAKIMHLAYHYVSLSLRLGLQRYWGPDYEAFALELLALLQKWRHVYSRPPEPPDPPDDADSSLINGRSRGLL